MAIHFYEEDTQSQLSQRRALSAFLKNVIGKFLPEIKSIHLNYIFCNDNYLLQINQDFLQHDTFTDIITFDLSDTPNILNAEIYISIERVKENAQKLEIPYTKELHRVLFHGVLHLCGFKDKTKTDKDTMRQMEDKCLEAYFNQKQL